MFISLKGKEDFDNEDCDVVSNNNLPLVTEKILVINDNNIQQIDW